MRLGPGRLFGALIVCAWVAILSTHLWRNIAARSTSIQVAVLPPENAKLTQRGAYYRGARIGFVRESMVPLDDGFRAQQEARFTLNLMGSRREVRLLGGATLGPGGELQDFEFGLSTQTRRSTYETTVTGKVSGIELELTIDSGGDVRIQRQTLESPVVLPLNLYQSLASHGLTSGETLRLSMFDPLTLTESQAEIEIVEPEIVRWGDREEEAYRVRTRFGGLVTTAWVNEKGELLKEENALGWTLLKEAPGSGLTVPSNATLPDVLTASAIPALGFSGDAEGLVLARLKLNRFPSEFPDLLGGRQQQEGEALVIRQESLPFETTTPLSDEERKEALASDGFIQADDPAIVAQAEHLTAGLLPLQAARALTEWVFESLTKSPTLSLPSAREVLAQKTGDCNEHTVLFAALARAAGVPTRVNTGLAFSGGQFYYHAWPEVWVGQWLAVDPTFGQFPADPLHLRLLIGGLEKQYEVLSLLGKGAYIEVLEVR